jgi:hypothetical protein
MLCFSALILFGFQVLSPPSTAFTLATIDIKPDTINLNRKGRWITAYIALSEGYNVSDIDKTTILLEGVFSPEWSNIEGDVLMVKFDFSQDLINLLRSRLGHMGNRASIELTVEGFINHTPPTPPTPFKGSDTVKIMDPIGEK